MTPSRTPPARRLSILVRAILLLAGTLPACKTAVVDLRAIDQPVLFGSTAHPDEREVQGYEAETGLRLLVIASGTSSSTVIGLLKNDPQAAAFESVGGDSRRGISGVRVDARAATLFLLLAVFVKVEADLSGTVVELPAPGSP